MKTASTTAPLSSATLEWRIRPVGERLLVIEASAAPSAALSCRLGALATYLSERQAQGALPGVSDIVPALASVGVHYRPWQVVEHLGYPTPFAALAAQLQLLLDDSDKVESHSPRLIEIPVCYGGEFGPDLAAAAADCGLSEEELIALHGAEVTVLMLGFAPGHPYLGHYDKRLALPRRRMPRTWVPAGSLGLANRQSVIYPQILPGGWSLIGRTPWRLFDPEAEQACRLRAGDRIRCVPIDAATFAGLQEVRP
ncbi:5-oxoprolinase subunit PxpB [Pseudomonas oryzihabitans]|uniref:5-oxoprolinase subunit PxpB n=1 Tax=Pseudomonas oryzihabitans TaxID=47885 RepID=UPI0005A70983|nr:5-oxoprolinase subunit PxpB [Pseudomonas oryzihabitans]MBA1261180.1 5-oxoprolinase subunit PxpB [Pseudomonas psychrotolerans]NMZ47627.1 5-oxoprolinase subunit PxpB [Pseudomonas oryzihabitans]